MIDLKTLAEGTFTQSEKDDITYIYQETFRKINQDEVRNALHLDNTGIAIAASNSNWACIGQYAKDKKLGEVKITHNNKRRWFVNGLVFTLKKVDEKLMPAKVYCDNGQTKLALDYVVDISPDFPLVIGYVPSTERNIIESIHIIKYKGDGSLDWNIPLFTNDIYINNTEETTTTTQDTGKLIKVKNDNKKVVQMFRD